MASKDELTLLIRSVADDKGLTDTSAALRRVSQEAQTTQQAAQQIGPRVQFANDLLKQLAEQHGNTTAAFAAAQSTVAQSLKVAPTLTAAELGIRAATPSVAKAAATAAAPSGITDSTRAIKEAELANRAHAAAVRASEIANREQAASLRSVSLAARQAGQAQKEAAGSIGGLGTGFASSAAGALRFAAALVGLNSAANLVQNVLASAARTALDFGAAMAGVGAVSGASAAQLANLGQLARTGGRDLGIGAVEGAKGLQELIKGGVSAQASLDGAFLATETLAKAGGVDLATAAEISATALNAFGLSANQLAHVADLVAGAANASSIGVDDFRQSLSQAGAVARTIGVTFDDTAVAIAELGQAGIKGSDAGTSLRTFLLSLTPSSQQASDELRRLGIVTADGANKFFDASGKAKGLADVSQVLKTSLAGMTDQQRLASLQIIFGTDALRAASILARDGSDGFDKLAAAMSKVSATDVSRKQVNSLSGDLDKLKASADNAAVSLEKAFDPQLRGVAQGATGALSDIQKREEALAAFQKSVKLAREEILAENAALPFGGLRPETIRSPVLEPLLEAAAQTRVSEHPERFIDFAGVQGKATAAALANEQLAGGILAASSAASAAAPVIQKYGETFNIVDATLQRTHRDLAQVAADIGELQGRSGTLSTILGGLGSNDTGIRAQIAALQDLQAIDARINAQRASGALELERQREQEATKITDPRDAAGAVAAKQRLDILDHLVPIEQARAVAAQEQAEAQARVTALEVQGQQQQLDRAQPLADLRTETLLRETRIADVQRQEADLADRITLASRTNLDLVRRTAEEREKALPATEALDDNSFEQRRLDLSIKATRADVRRGVLDRSALTEIPDQRQQLRQLRREAPRLELDAAETTRTGDLLERQVTREQLQQTIKLTTLQQQQRVLEDQLLPLRTAQRLTDERTAAIQRQVELQQLGETAQRTAAQQALLTANAAAQAADDAVKKSIDWATNIAGGLANIKQAWQDLSTLPQPSPPSPPPPPPILGQPPSGLVNPDRDRTPVATAVRGPVTINMTFTGPVNDPQAIAHEVLAALSHAVDSSPQASPVGLSGAIG